MRPLHGLIFGMFLLACVTFFTGCQSHIGGQTLPSPFYLDDDVQYHAPGSKNILQSEAAKIVTPPTK